MRHLLSVVVALLALGAGALVSAEPESVLISSPVAGACTAPARTPNPSINHGTPGAEEAEAAAGNAAGGEAPLPPITPPPGTPAGSDLLHRIQAAEETIASCFRAGDFAAFTALMTPKALLAELGLSDPRATPAHSASYLILRQEIMSVRDAQTHADGRVSADVVFAFEGQRMRARDLFVERDGQLLLDEVIELPPAGAAATPAPLDAALLPALTIIAFTPDAQPSVVMVSTLGGAMGMQPGGTIKLVLGVIDYEVCGTGHRCFVPVSVSATWSVTPADAARIDPATGILSVDLDTPGGSVLTAKADIEGGRHEVVTEVNVYTPEADPLLGYWREEVQLACGSGAEVVPTVAIEEMVFAADGTFAVTWTPFESYVDYWGTYAFDLARGTLELSITGGNNIPPDADGSGRFAFDAAGRLLLTDLWLGAREPETGPANCGHRFVR